jgi:mono/diheme cytochrome c family protein
LCFCVSLLVVGGASACRSKPREETPAPAKPAPPPPPVVENPATAARQIFRMRCTACHGEGGRGDGPGAAALTPKPRAFTDAAWQEGVKDEHLRDIIVKGGAAVGKSPGMPPNPDLEKKPDVVDELVKLVRGFKS